MGVGLKDLKSHLLDSLPRQLAEDTFAAFMEAQKKGSGTDWSDQLNPGEGLDIDDDGNITFNGQPVPSDFTAKEIDSPAGDSAVEKTQRKMSREEAQKEAGRIFENRGATNIEITEEMIKDVFGEENGEIVWNQIVATSILDRIVIPNEPKGKMGKLAEKQRMGVGRGTELYKKKHKVPQSIMQSGDYYPGTPLGFSRSKPETYVVREKDKGGANFSICIDVSTSNGSRSNPNSRLNAVCCLGAALVTEARMLDLGVSLYIFPNGKESIPKGHPLITPFETYPVEQLVNWNDPSQGYKTTQEGVDVDPRYYFQDSKQYDDIIRVLTEEIDSYGGERPAQVFSRLTYDLQQLPKKDKKTVIWIADCTIPEFYMGIKNFYEIIEQSGNEFWILNVGGQNMTTVASDMNKFFAAQGYKNVHYIPLPDFSSPGVNPDTLPSMLAEKMGLKKVQIKSTNGLRDMVG